MIPRPIVFEISNRVYAINEYGLDSMFLIVGEKKAALIDTGMGCFDLKALVESITDLSLVVLLTHGHVDHCGGWDQFDEVWLHPADREKALAVTRERRVESCRRMRGLEGDADVWDYDDESPREWTRLPAIRELADGMSFDLGGRQITTVYTPGHSAGSCSFIDSKSRILFSGDACNVNLMVTDCPVETELEGLLRLKAREDCFERNFNGHLGFSSGMNHISMPRSTMDDAIEICRRVLGGKAQPRSTARSRFADGGEVGTYLYGAVSLTWRLGREQKEEAECL